MTLRTMYDCVYVSRSRSTGAYLKANEEEEVVMDSMSGGLIRQRGIFLFFIFIFIFLGFRRRETDTRNNDDEVTRKKQKWRNQKKRER